MEQRKQIRFTKAAKPAKHKEGGHVLLSQAFVKASASNLIPRVHVKRGDMVILMNGPKKEDKKRDSQYTKRLAERNAFKGSIGKVLTVFPKEGKIVVEGVNMVTNFVNNRSGMPGGETGMIRREAPIFASRVMLFDPEKKKPVRANKRKELSL